MDTQRARRLFEWLCRGLMTQVSDGVPGGAQHLRLLPRRHWQQPVRRQPAGADILLPVLFAFYLSGIRSVWRWKHTYAHPALAICRYALGGEALAA